MLYVLLKIVTIPIALKINSEAVDPPLLLGVWLVFGGKVL